MPYRSSSRPRHQSTLSALLHRLVLLLTLVIGAGALVYNAVSIVSGEEGLIGLTKLFDAATTDPSVPSRSG